MASACLYLVFAKPNLIVNTDLLIILCNYFSLICKAEILYPPQLYLKRFILYVRSLVILLQLFWIPALFRDIGRCLSKPAQISWLTLYDIFKSWLLRLLALSSLVQEHAKNYCTNFLWCDQGGFSVAMTIFLFKSLY